MNEVMDARLAPGQEAPQAVCRERLTAAFQRARDELLAQRETRGHWVGQLSSSAFATAAAISALALVERRDATTPTGHFVSEARESFLSELIVDGIHWLAEHQNADGGWGDTDKSRSNIATTMLAVAAFNLTGVPVKFAGILERAQKFVEQAGGVRTLKQYYGKDESLASAVLMNCALAGIVPWRKVRPRPLELATMSESWRRFLRVPGIGFAAPAIIAVGLARFHHAKPYNPLLNYWRGGCIAPSLETLRELQPASGGFFESIPLTSFVVTSLASMGRVNHPVAQAGLEFIVESIREDGSWPIETDFATWNTSLAVNALANSGEDIWQADCLQWLLNCQQQTPNAYTQAAGGGWGWSDLSGVVPDVGDTSAALQALAHFRNSSQCDETQRERIRAAARKGLTWLLSVQNVDGGWPALCSGSGRLPYDRSGDDLTAHALQALCAWRDELDQEPRDEAIAAGLRYLVAQQQPEGAWVPLWVGDQNHPHSQNATVGTAQVVLALCEVFRQRQQFEIEWEPALHHGVQWLGDHVRSAGSPLAAAEGHSPISIEAMSLALEALLAARELGLPADDEAVDVALNWLLDRLEHHRPLESSPIGLYCPKLWYYEKLSPVTSAVSALGRAARMSVPPASQILTHAHPR